MFCIQQRTLKTNSLYKNIKEPQLFFNFDNTS